MFADFFLQKTKSELGKQIDGFEDDVIELFVNYSWPGNLRELRNVVRRAALLTSGNKISVQALPVEIVLGTQKADASAVSQIHHITLTENTTPVKKEIHLKDTAAKAEYDAILNALEMVNFNKTKAANLLNIDRKTLYNKIRSYESNQTNSVG
jgi:two-component system response regulator HydG